MRVDRTFAFIDLCGFTAFSERHGDDVAVTVLAELRSALREIAARRGVRVAKWLGDGAMLGSTSSTSLVAMVVEIRHRLRSTIPDLSVRVGMDRGPVIMFEGDDYIGRAVNVAARLCGKAAEGQILGTLDVLDDLPPWVLADQLSSVELKGFAHRIEIASVDLALPRDAHAATDPVCGLTLPIPFMVASPETALSMARFCSVDCAEAFAGRMNPPRRSSVSAVRD